MPWTHLRLSTALLLTAGLATLLLAPIPVQAETAAPELSIAVDNGRTSVAVGDALAYVITVQNLAATGVRDLRISQTMPEGLDFRSADKSGKAGADSVVWTVDLVPHGSAVLHTTMQVASTPKEVLRLATVACASIAADTPPLVCATHSDQLPAGAAASESQGVTADAGADIEVDAPGLSAIQISGLAALLIVAALVAAGLWWRTTRVTPTGEGTAHSSDPRDTG